PTPNPVFPDSRSTLDRPRIRTHTYYHRRPAQRQGVPHCPIECTLPQQVPVAPLPTPTNNPAHRRMTDDPWHTSIARTVRECSGIVASMRGVQPSTAGNPKRIRVPRTSRAQCSVSAHHPVAV